MTSDKNDFEKIIEPQSCRNIEKIEEGHIPNQIDIDFNNMMNFIKEKNLEQVKEIIKHNYEYRSKTDLFNYARIVDFYNVIKLWGTIDLKAMDYELIDNNAKALVEHRQDIEWLYSRLGDYRSKKILTCILYYWLMLDYQKIDQIQDKFYSQYFDLDLVHCDENEVFVDIGSYIGDTLVSYSKTFGVDCYKRTYCYEIVPNSVEYINRNIEQFNLKNVVVRQKGASDKKGKLFIPKDEASSISQLSEEGEICVETVTIDDDIDEPVTFIKMDIEGAEEQALLGCRKKILENHPKLALSAYHNNSHLWELAKIIEEIDPTYNFYLRYYGGPLIPTEYILYAI